MKRAVFFDRDGTLNVEKRYLGDPDKLELVADIIPALKQIQEAGFELFIVTNQSGIGRGYYTVDDMHAVNEKLIRLLKEQGIRFSKIYYAPEAPEQPSYGRKPSPQFLLDAAEEFDIDLSRSFMIGDKPSDLQCGWNAGVQASLLVMTGYGSEVKLEPDSQKGKLVEVDSLSVAADYITTH